VKIKNLLESPEDDLYNKIEKDYPLAGSNVNGLDVSHEIHNTDSIKASLDHFKILKGIRVVSMSSFGGPQSVFYARDDFDRARALAQKISESKTITPLIIVIDNEGPYILEGAHRYVALHYLHIKEFPALVVIDTESFTH
jgi:hypothetical protein